MYSSHHARLRDDINICMHQRCNDHSLDSDAGTRSFRERDQVGVQVGLRVEPALRLEDARLGEDVLVQVDEDVADADNGL